MRQRIRVSLQRHFAYPLVARRRGWQGTVVLAFEVTANGRIRDVQVARSSGHTLLDRSARQSLEKVRIDGASHLLGGRAVKLEVPVQYRLTSG